MTNHEVALTKQLQAARARCAELEAALVEACASLEELADEVETLVGEDIEARALNANIARLRAVAGAK